MKLGPNRHLCRHLLSVLWGERLGQMTPNLSHTHSHIYPDKPILQAFLHLPLCSCGLSALEQFSLQRSIREMQCT